MRIPPWSSRHGFFTLLAVIAALVASGLALRKVVWIRHHSRAVLTMAHLRTAATLLEAYAETNGHYPTHDSVLLIPPFADGQIPETQLPSRHRLSYYLSRTDVATGWPLSTDLRFDRLTSALQSFAQGDAHINHAFIDGWGCPILVGVSRDGNHYVVASGGANHRLEPAISAKPAPLSEPWRDVVLSDGMYISGPDNTTW